MICWIYSSAVSDISASTRTVARTTDRPGESYFVPNVLFYIFFIFCLSSSCVSLSSFIAAVLMRKCMGKHSCTSATFLVILNESCFLRSPGIDFFWLGSVIKLKTIIIIIIIIFNSCCFHAQVFGRALVREFHISYRNTEWGLPSSLCESGDEIWKQSVAGLNSQLTNPSTTLG